MMRQLIMHSHDKADFPAGEFKTELLYLIKYKYIYKKYL